MKNQLKEFRKARHITQQEIADICGVAQNTISNWESGRQDISIEYVNKIANHYNVEPQKIVRYDDVENTLNIMSDLSQLGMLGLNTTPNQIKELEQAIKTNPEIKKQVDEMRERNDEILEYCIPLQLIDRANFDIIMDLLETLGDLELKELQNVQYIIEKLSFQDINTIKKIKEIIDIIIRK